MEKEEIINKNINYAPCIIKTCSFGNILNNNEIELFVTGTNESKTKSFLHYFSYDLNSKEEDKKDNVLLFQTWNYTKSKIIIFFID